MDAIHYAEMSQNADSLMGTHALDAKTVYLFGHCNATEELARFLLRKGFSVRAILDNNEAKQGYSFLGIPVVAPGEILREGAEHTVVCIAARAHAAMREQLLRMGFRGEIHTLVNYDSYSE